MIKEERHPQLVLENDQILRINKELASEIGLNESIVLLQLDFLISKSKSPQHDGRQWTYQSADDLHNNHFPFLSKSTIARTLKSLVNSGYISVGNFNQHRYDRTQWFALNEEGIGKLKSVFLLSSKKSQIEKCIPQTDDMNHVKMGNALLQNEQPIPDTTTKITTESGAIAPHSSSSYASPAAQEAQKLKVETGYAGGVHRERVEGHRAHAKPVIHRSPVSRAIIVEPTRKLTRTEIAANFSAGSASGEVRHV